MKTGDTTRNVRRCIYRAFACVVTTFAGVMASGCHGGDDSSSPTRGDSPSPLRDASTTTRARLAVPAASERAPSLERAGLGAARDRTASATMPARGMTDDEDGPLDDSEPALFQQLDESFGRPGEVKDGVYRLVTPRADLYVTFDGMDVPTGAFLESDFRFWRCPCGKLLAAGQFVVADYEANDVVDELQTGHFHLAGIGPLFLNEKPRLLVIRFQGEGRPKSMAAALQSALSYTGDAPHAPAPADLSPMPDP